ncbi:hypothetical protein GH714_036794 [Hevea brasiliensis]|uniref:Importin subunit beta-1/Transportin-1-like TPR repeats domain-containing protein n=1 Tax=Hevea brasiliensis TaxID=3981 RepID=A0A6A6KY98_HEVBR|nr:hypothetical protein GH714_036794 [Hevea brasiliensis]
MSEEKEHEDAIQDLMSKAIEILIFEDKLAFDKSNEDYAQMAFEELIELTKERPDLFLPHLKDMFQCIYQILDNSEFEEKTRFLAEELMVLLLLHYRDEKPVLLRTGKFISQILSRLQDIDDDPSWDGNDNFDDDSRVFVQGVKRLAQYAPAIGGQFILEKFKIMFDFNFFSEKWQSRHAVISCSIIARNCPKESINELDLLVEQPMKAVDDTHFRVRWAAINAIQEFSKNLNPDFQFQYKLLGLFYFSNDCTSGLLTPYMDEIVNKLLRCLQRGKQLLKEEALTAVGSLVSSSEDHFQVYYKTVMPHLKVIMMKAAAESNSVLLRKSIECITMVGLAVGKKMFSDDIQMVVQSLISLQESKLERGDPMRNQVLRAWGRLCKCLGQDFQPYLGVVIPHLLQSAQLESRVTSPKYTETMPVLLNISKASMEKGYVEGYQGLPFEELCFYTIPALVEALHKEPSMEIQLTILDSLEECMEMSGPTLKTEQIKRFLHIILEILITSSTLSRSRVEYEQIEKIHITAGDCLITFTEVYKASLSQFFDQLLSCMAYMRMIKMPKERRTAFRIFSDVAEKCQEEALKYCEGNLRFLFDACYERNPEVQQIVAKCIGVSAQFGGAIFKSHIKEALGGLNSIMRDPETLNPDYLPAHDAAVSALEKYTFSMMSNSMKLRFSEELIHNDNAHLSKVIAVFAEILWAGQNLASKGTVNRIIEQLGTFRAIYHPIHGHLLSSLAPSRAKILQLKLLS